MGAVFTKLFRSFENNHIVVDLVRYNPSNDYYNLIEEQYKLGKKQIILNSSFMIQLLEFFFIEKKFSINSFEFAEDDGEYSERFKEIVKDVNKKRVNFKSLLNNLETIRSEDSIEIFQMKLKDDENDINLSFKSNGIVIMNKEFYESEEKNQHIKGFLERILNE